MDTHHKAMLLLCRVCGRRCVKKEALQEGKKGINKGVHSNNLLQNYQIDITSDTEGVHPQWVCLSCIASFGKKSLRPVVVWTEHDSTCKACQLVTTKGRPPKAVKVAAKRRKEREKEEQEREEVDVACDKIIKSVNSGDGPTNKMQKVASAIIKKMMAGGDSTSSTVELPTGGPKLTVKKVVAPRVPADAASKRTIRERAKRAEEDLAFGAGGSGAGATLFAKLLKRLGRKELHKVLEEHGLLSVKIPLGHDLAMKARLGWSWAEMRLLKIWLRAYKVQMVCEGRSRKKKVELLKSPSLQAECVPCLFKEDDEFVTHLTPMVYIPDLTSNILDTIDELDKYDLLTWDGIPEDEIWVKLGGDKGGSSTKFYYQIVNTDRPNSVFNTTVFCIYEADENVPNLQIALERYKDQVQSLQETEWRGKKLVVWLCGDYEIERKLIGLQGASATYPCLYCLVNKKDLSSGEDAPERTLDNLEAGYQNVKSNGFTATTKRQNYSISHQSFFNVPIDQICPPGLHISLGLWEKFFGNLERDLQWLGHLIAEYQAEKDDNNDGNATPSTSASLFPKFQSFIEKTRETMSQVLGLEEEAETAREQMTDLEYGLMTQALDTNNNTDPSQTSQDQTKEIEKLQQQAQNLEKKAQDLRNQNKLDKAANPLIQRLDKTLQEFKVKRQAFAPNSFVGNHVNKCLKPENYTRLLEAVVEATKELGKGSDELEDAAVQIQMRYLLLFEKFIRCHQVYNTSQTLNTEQIDELENNIMDLTSYYRERFPSPKYSFTPKFHFLYRMVPECKMHVLRGKNCY